MSKMSSMKKVIKLISKMVGGKRKYIQKKRMIETPCESNIDTVDEEHVLENIYILILLSMMKGIAANSSQQTVEQLCYNVSNFMTHDSIISKRHYILLCPVYVKSHI